MVPFPYVSGRFYRSQTQTGQNASVPSIINTTYYAPIYIVSAASFNQMVFVGGATFSGTSSTRLGIYNNDPANYIPSTVVIDAGTVSITSAGQTATQTIAWTPNTGWYWLAFNNISVGSSNTYAGPAQFPFINTPVNFGYLNGGSGGVFMGYTQTVDVSGGFLTATGLTAVVIYFPCVSIRAT